MRNLTGNTISYPHTRCSEHKTKWHLTLVPIKNPSEYYFAQHILLIKYWQKANTKEVCVTDDRHINHSPLRTLVKSICSQGHITAGCTMHYPSTSTTFIPLHDNSFCFLMVDFIHFSLTLPAKTTSSVSLPHNLPTNNNYGGSFKENGYWYLAMHKVCNLPKKSG